MGRAVVGGWVGRCVGVGWGRVQVEGSSGFWREGVSGEELDERGEEGWWEMWEEGGTGWGTRG